MNRLFSSNIAVRIISLLSALVIWVVASDQYLTQSTSQEMSKNFYRVPIEAVNEPSGYSVSYDHSDIESLVLKGNASLLSSMLGQEITAKIDLEGYSEGEFDVPIQLSYPAGLSLVALQPARVHVKLVSNVSRVMDLEVVILNQDEIEDRVPKISYKPDSIMLEGPRQLVEEVDKIVILVDLKEHEEGLEKAYDVLVLDPEGQEMQGITLQPNLVSLNLKYLPIKELVMLFPDDLIVPEGFEVESYNFEPSFLEVYAEAGELDKIISLKTVVEDIVISEEEQEQDRIHLSLAGHAVLEENSKLEFLQEAKIVLTLILAKSVDSPP